MRWPGHLYVDLRIPHTVVRIDQTIHCPNEKKSDLYVVTDIVNKFSYTVDGDHLSAASISDLDALEWLGSA